MSLVHVFEDKKKYTGDCISAIQKKLRFILQYCEKKIQIGWNELMEVGTHASSW